MDDSTHKTPMLLMVTLLAAVFTPNAYSWFGMPSDCKEILVERAHVKGIEQTDSLWDLSGIEVIDDNAGYRVKRYDDSSFLYLEGSQRYYFAEKVDSLVLVGYENRHMRGGQVFGAPKDYGEMPVAIINKGSTVDFDAKFSFGGSLFLYNDFQEKGSISVSNGKGILVMDGDTLRNARTIKTLRESDITFAEDTVKYIYESILVFNPSMDAPIIELRQYGSGPAGENQWTECIVLSSAIENGLLKDGIEMGETTRPNLPVTTSAQPSALRVSFMVDQPHSDIEIILCSLSGIVYHTESKENVPMGEYDTEIPLSSAPHERALLIIRVNGISTKKMIDL